MLKLITKLLSSVKSFVTSLFSRTETSLNGVGFSLWTILVVVLIAGACLGVVVPIGGGAPPPPPQFEAELTQIVPAPKTVDYTDTSSVAGKLDINMINIQRFAKVMIDGFGTSAKCGVSKNPHNTSTISRGDHFDINFNLNITHKTCVGWKLGQSTSHGSVVVQVWPYQADGMVKFKTVVVKTDMQKLYGVRNIRSDVKNELVSTFKEKIDNNDKLHFKVPDGIKVNNFQFTDASGGEIHLIVDFSVPMPPSA